MTFTKFIWSPVGKKVVMAISGGCLTLFILIHLIGNSTTFLGAESFISYAAHLHSLGPLVSIFELGLLTIFAIHITFAVFLYFENLTARPGRYYIQRNAGGRTWGSRTMPYTGLVILLFVVLHLSAFRGIHPESVALVVRSVLGDSFTALYYILSLTALIIHLSHGLWSIFQSLGLINEQYENFLKKGAKIISIAGGLVFIAIPVLINIAPDFLR
jgi:succinate dehydrogenase / fumarate reductase cytochrome b subunit